MPPEPDYRTQEHRDEWVSYCSHTGHERRQDCRCAPDLIEVVEERDALRKRVRGAVDALREVARERHVNAHGQITAKPSHAAQVAQAWLDAHEVTEFSNTKAA